MQSPPKVFFWIRSILYKYQRSLHLMLAMQVSVVEKHSDWVNFQYFGALNNVTNCKSNYINIKFSS